MERLSERRGRDGAAREAGALDRFVGRNEHLNRVYGVAEWGHPDRPPLAAVLREWMLPVARAGGRVLEIGPGGGRWTRYLLAEPAVTELLAVDATWSSYEAIRAACAEMPLSVWAKLGFFGDGLAGLSALPAGCVDYAFSFDTFVHFPRVLFRGYLREIARLLAPGAVCHLDYGHDFGAGAGRPPSWHYWPPLEIRAALRRVGLEPVRSMDFRAGHGKRLVELCKPRGGQP